MSVAGAFTGPNTLFVTLAGDVYIDNGNNQQIYRRTPNGTNTINSTSITSSCFGIFMDINNALYCSLQASHMVIKISFNGSNTNITTVAGTGSNGSNAAALSFPQGIFVDKNLNLYVADCSNNRIQRFSCGQQNAITVAGNGNGGISNLTCPTGIVLDADNFLYIVDNNNHRIIQSTNNISRCIIGCTGTMGLASNKLNYPNSASFDSFGNLFVVDNDNHRIQKFFFQSSSCRK